MKTIYKRISVILTVIMYMAIFYAVPILIQLIYMLWQNSLGEITLSEIARNTTNNSYAISVIATVVTFWIYGHIRKAPLDKAIENKKTPPIIAVMAICLAVGLRILVTVYYSMSQSVEMLKRSIDEAASITPELTGIPQLMIALFSIMVVAPLFEELVFRGIIMGELMRIMRPWAAIGVQALLFGVAHAVLFQSIFAFMIGIILGVVYYRTQSLKTVALCHAFFNLSVVFAQDELTVRTGIMMAAMGLALVICSLTYILANCKRK